MIHEFNRSPWWVKALLGVIALIVVLAIVGSVAGGDDAKDAETSAPTQGSPVRASTADKTAIQPQSTATASAPTSTSVPAPPPWQAGGLPLTAVSVTAALRDADRLLRSVDLGKPRDISIDGGWITVTYKAEDAAGETDLLTIGAQTSFSAHRKLFQNPDVTTVTVILVGDWTDQLGNTAEEDTTVSTLDRATAAGVNWDGLADLVRGDNKHMFCVSDAWRVHLGIFSRLKDRGCLTSAVGGS